jgi:ribosome-binding factor A
MTSFRLQRINKQIQREISLLLEYKVKNDTAKLAIITGVECTRDLQHASVFFTTVDTKIRSDVLKILKKLAGSIRGMLGKQLHLRQIPELTFRIDTSEEYGRAIDRILDKIRENQSESESAEVDEYNGESAETDI